MTTDISVDAARARHDAALALARQGFHLLPLAGKIPAKGITGGSKDATCDPAVISRWWAGRYKGANIGIATGQPLPDGRVLVVVDADGEEGIASLRSLTAEHGGLSGTLQVATGGGGIHVYLGVPAGTVVRNAQSMQDGWTKVDIRGSGGYVVAAGSVHPDTGREYVVSNDMPIADAPAAWLQALTAPVTRARARVQVAAGEPITSGARHTTWISRIGKLIDDGHTQAEVLALMRELNKRSEDEPTPDATVVSYVEEGFSRWTATRSVVPDEDQPDLHVARSVAATLKDRLAADPTAAYRKDMVAALSMIRDDPAEWVPAAAVLRKSSQLREMEKAIKRHRSDLAAARLEAIGKEPVGDEPISLACPPGYAINEGGVWVHGGDDTLERILHVPLYLTARLKDIETGDERVSLAWKRDGTWHSTNCDASLTASAQRIVALADHGLPVNSGSAAAVVKYLTDLAASNPEIPVKVRTERTGWLGSSRFYPGAADGIEFDPRDQSLKHIIGETGTLEQWVEIVAPLRAAYPLLRLQLAASFAGPLLRKIAARPFVVHLWGRSGGGKTATMFVASSVWGSQKYMKSFMTTPYALTVNAAERTDLPLCVNEKQLWSHYKTPVDRVIYELVEGVSKGQGAKEGGTREQLRWLCPILTNGESPLSTDDSEQGVRTRALEVAGEPISDEAVASALYDQLARQHGTAGPAYVRRMLQVPVATMHGDLERIRSVLEEAGRGHVKTHVGALITNTLADYYSGVFVFGEDPEAAILSSVGWALELLEEHLETASQVDQGDRVYEELCGIVRANLGVHFALTKDGSAAHEQWGFLHESEVWVLTHKFRDMGETAKRGYRGVLRDLGAKGLIRKHSNGKDATYSIKADDNARYYVLAYDPHVQHGSAHVPGGATWVE